MPRHPFNFQKPPRKDVHGGECGGAGRAYSRAGTESERGIKYKIATRSARVSQFRSKKVRAKVNMTPQKETSDFDGVIEIRAFGAVAGNWARRFATNWKGAENARRADLSLVSHPKAI